MEEDGDDEGDDHDDHGADGDGDGEEADHADFREVDARDEVLEGAGVDQALGVDVGVGHEEDVVAVGEVEEGDAGGGETEDEGCDERICDGWVR